MWTDESYYTGPQLTDTLVRGAETTLGVRLPRSYVDILAVRNGGTPRRQCLRTPFPTSWAPDHFKITGILGVGGDWGIDNPTRGSAYLIAEWGYPDIGVVICDTPAAGPDTVMLDYTAPGEPAVVYIDEDRVPRRIADSFEAFLEALVPCSEFD